MWILVNGKCLNIMYTKSGTMLSTLYVFTHLVLKTVIILILQMKELGLSDIKPYTPNWHHTATKWGNPSPKRRVLIPNHCFIFLCYVFWVIALKSIFISLLFLPVQLMTSLLFFPNVLVFIFIRVCRDVNGPFKKKKIHRDKIRETIKWWGSSQVLTPLGCSYHP